MAAATIAYDELKPDVRKKVDALLASTGSDFIEASTWADDTRTRETAPWHFTNQHFRTDGKPTTNKPEGENVVWAIRKFSGVLADHSASGSAKTEALRYVIHFVADVHQPLHTVARDTDALPDGDRGGNDFHIEPPTGLDPRPHNLHFLWDMGGGLFPRVHRPADASDEQTIRSFAARLLKDYPAPQRAVAVSDPEAWAREGLELAKREVYDLQEGSTPNAAYLANCRRISGQRIVLAGKRLAALLNKILQ